MRDSTIRQDLPDHVVVGVTDEDPAIPWVRSTENGSIEQGLECRPVPVPNLSRGAASEEGLADCVCKCGLVGFRASREEGAAQRRALMRVRLRRARGLRKGEERLRASRSAGPIIPFSTAPATCV